jgi:hypothetical protein
MNFVAELWTGETALRKWTLHFLADVYMTLWVLAILSIFWEAIAFLRFQNYPGDKLASLEEIHFRSSESALCVLGFYFVLKLAISLWPKKN